VPTKITFIIDNPESPAAADLVEGLARTGVGFTGLFSDVD
jgi:hypothetical protein